MIYCDNAMLIFCPFQLKLDLNEGDASSISDLRNGSFVMYNCARLATLFLHFQQAVEKGIRACA